MDLFIYSFYFFFCSSATENLSFLLLLWQKIDDWYATIMVFQPFNQFILVTHPFIPSCFRALVRAFFCPSLYHSDLSIFSIKTSNVCVCGRLNCLAVICNVNMRLRMRASLPLDAAWTYTHKRALAHTCECSLHIQRATSSCLAQLCYSY